MSMAEAGESVREADEVDRTPQRTVVIGYEGFVGIDGAAWSADSLPNIPDYDLVVVSMPHIEDSYLMEADDDRFKSMRADLVRLLHTGGRLVVLLAPIRSVYREHRFPTRLSNIEWCPVTLETPEEAGRSIVWTESTAHDSYLKRMSSWSFFVRIPRSCLSNELTAAYGSPDNVSYSLPLSSYVENRYGQTLVGEFSIALSYKARRARRGYGDPPDDEPDHRTGNIVLLPLIEGFSPEEALLEILTAEVGYTLNSVEPDWAKGIPLPLVDDLAKEVSKVESEIAGRRRRIEALDRQIGSVTGFRRLLFSSGRELEDTVKRSLEMLGASVTPAQHGQEEYIIEANGEKALVEVKGVAKSISLTHLRQLSDYLLRHEEEAGTACRGILIGNAWRLQRPEERNSPDMPEFPENVVQRASQLGVGLLPTRVLFEAVRTALIDEKSAEVSLGKIMSTVGVVEI